MPGRSRGHSKGWATAWRTAAFITALGCIGIALWLGGPPPSGAVPAQTTYTVQPGDSLWTIARRHGVAVDDLVRANPGVDARNLRIGQTLTIPAAAGNRQGAGNASPAVVRNDEIDLLARVIAAEAEGEPYAGMVGVAAVILNRVRNPGFPNTLAGVIYQPLAFESVSNGLVWRRTPQQSAYQAAWDALNGWDPTYGALFFWNPSKPVSPWVWTRQIIVRIGNHVFAR